LTTSTNDAIDNSSNNNKGKFVYNGWLDEEMNEINNNGALEMEAVANHRICQDMLGTHLCFATRDRRFREAFGISSKSAFILWTLLNVPNDGPEGGRKVHLLWVLLFLKTYNTQHDLAGRCGVSKDTFKRWRDLFLERIASLAEEELVSDVIVLF
jgi:hypothetical protein